MGVAEKRKPGRPVTGRAMGAAERARRYRARLRERGVRVATVMRQDPFLEALRFKPDTLLTPGEQEVLRRFCVGLKKLPRLPRSVGVFGSRAKGGSHAHSDLDVAVMMDESHGGSFQAALSAAALDAQRPYWLDQYGISLRPVPFYRGKPSAFQDAIRDELEVVWTRP